jgi:hypothetical protein
MLTATEFLSKYQNVLKRLFFAIIGKNKTHSQGVFRGFFGKYLYDCGLKLVSKNSKQYNDTEDDKDCIVIDSTSSSSSLCIETTDKMNPTETTTAEDEVDYNARLVDFIDTKFDANSTITFEHLAKLEELVYGTKCYKYADLLHRNRALIEKKGLVFSLIADTNKQKKPTIEDPMMWDHLAQLKHGLAHLGELSESEKRLCAERFMSEYYGIEFKEQCSNGGKQVEVATSQKENGLFVIYQDSLLLDNDSLVLIAN